MKPLSIREIVMVFVMTMLVVNSLMWCLMAQVARARSHAQYICSTQAQAEISHGHTDLGIKYIDGANRAYFTSECSRYTGIEIILHPSG